MWRWFKITVCHWCELKHLTALLLFVIVAFSIDSDGANAKVLQSTFACLVSAGEHVFDVFDVTGTDQKLHQSEC